MSRLGGSVAQPFSAQIIMTAANSIRARIGINQVKLLRPGQTLWDADLKGFCIRRRAGGTLTYAVKARVKGRQSWITIGRHGSPWTPETARRRAQVLLGEVAEGHDPQQLKIKERAKLSVKLVFEQFMAHHGPKLKPRTKVAYQRLFDIHLKPAFGTRAIEDVTRMQVSRFHAKLAGTPAEANFALACLSKFMSWAEEHSYRPERSNPCYKIPKYRIAPRERFLTTVEFGRLGRILDQVEADGSESVFALAAIRLLCLTGARLSEILTLKWSYVDRERGFLALPDPKTGNKVIRLSAPAIHVLTALPRVKGNPYVIIGREDESCLVNLQKPWRRIRQMADLKEVRLHDLRHSFASVAAVSGGASLSMIGKLLGHNQPQTTARYTHLTDDPLRKLNDTIGRTVAAAMSADAQRSQI
jgi:integrase